MRYLATAAHDKLDPIYGVNNLFLTAPETEFCDFLSEIDDFRKLLIDNTSVKANSNGKLKKYYRQVLNTGLKAVAHLAEELAIFECRYLPYNFCRMVQLKGRRSRKTAAKLTA